MRWEGGGSQHPAQGLRMCREGPAIGACIPPLLILKVKYIASDLLLFTPHPLRPLHIFSFLSEGLVIHPLPCK